MLLEANLQNISASKISRYTVFKLMTPIIQIIQHTQQRNKIPINYIAQKNGIKSYYFLISAMK